ncbi:MAG: hypothetical protein ACRDX8_15090, partial [Acidimicrobiales bacterium]
MREFEGVKMVGGMPYCPTVPADLAVIEHRASLVLADPKQRASEVDRAAYEKAKRELAASQAKMAERDLYRFRMVQGTREGAKDPGKTRWECPAQGGKVRCVTCPASAFLAGVPEVEHPPAAAAAPRICTQRTITIPGSVTPKFHQELVWG